MLSPFDPILRSSEVENIVMREGARRYYRFRYAEYYGGVITGDATGCNLLCAYCWNYFRNEDPLRFNDLGFMTPSEVSKKLQAMGKSNDCDKFRISGSEPFLGEASTQHLANIIKSMPSSDFIIETNALMIGYNPSLIGYLVDLHNVTLRIAIKADSPKMFELVTGAIGSYQPYQLKAIQALRAEKIPVSIAYMAEIVDPAKLGLGSDEDFDTERLRYYQGTKDRLDDRGILISKAVKKPVRKVVKTPCEEPKRKPREGIVPQGTLEYWEDKGDIT